MTLVQRHPLLSCLVLTFAISWDGFVLVIGPDGFSSTQLGKVNGD